MAVFGSIFLTGDMRPVEDTETEIFMLLPAFCRHLAAFYPALNIHQKISALLVVQKSLLKQALREYVLFEH